jgi:hypothetical protein
MTFRPEYNVNHMNTAKQWIFRMLGDATVTALSTVAVTLCMRLAVQITKDCSDSTSAGLWGVSSDPRALATGGIRRLEHIDTDWRSSWFSLDSEGFNTCPATSK